MFQNHSLVIVTGDDIVRCFEAEKELMKTKKALHIPGLSMMLLHGSGFELTYSVGDSKLYDSHSSTYMALK